MRFHILGPLLVRGGDGRSCPLSPRLARVLAVLLLSANEIVTRRHLIDAVWEDEEPTTAARQVRNCISALRRHMAVPGRTTPLIVADGPGYRIQVEPGELDADVFADQLSMARTLAGQRQTVQAVRRLRSALHLWRGPALAGMHGQVISSQAARLNEQRLAALEFCHDLELDLGRHDSLIGDLTGLVATNPLRERLVGQLMLALHRSGRTAEALAVYRRLAERLADELGLDPGDRLRDLHTAILRNRPGPGRAPSRDRPAEQNRPTLAEPVTVPRQLPAAVGHFVGRGPELGALARLFEADDTQPGTVMISAIGGTAGVGKTALAVHWAHTVAEAFPDGQLYANLHGFDPTGSPTPAADVVRSFLDALGVPPSRIPVGLDAQAALYRSLLAERRILVLLDNARHVDQVRPLLPGSSTCLVLVTSRNLLSGLVTMEGAHPIVLDLLTVDEARELLSRRLGPGRVAAEPAAVDQIIARCARLPLALAIVAARAAAQPDLSLSTLADHLAEGRGPLDTFADADRAADLRAVFSGSYDTLTGPAARTFRLLALHPGPDVSAAAAASLLGLPPQRVRPLLDELTRAHLLIRQSDDRYAFHDLLRAYATELAAVEDTAAQRRAALRRLLDHYLHTAYAADQQLNPHRYTIRLDPPADGVRPERLTVLADALAWFTAEHAVLLAVVTRSTEPDLVPAGAELAARTWQLAWVLTTFLHRQGYWHDWATTQDAGLAAALRAGDVTGQARCHHTLGIAQSRLGRSDEALENLRQALDLYGRLGDRIGQANTHVDLALTCERQRRYEDALEHSARALDLFRLAGHRVGQATALNALGWLATQLGDHRQALVHCRRALRLQQLIGDRRGEAPTWDSLGFAHHQVGEYSRAVECYRRALALYRELGERYLTANTLVRLGETHLAASAPAAARDAWQQAAAIFTELGLPDADRTRTRLHHLDNG